MRDSAVRRERLAETIREILSQLLLTGAKDPRLTGVVISAVELSGDLKQARAFFSVIGDEERERQVADGLRQAAGYLRREISHVLRLHSTPELEFRRDKGFERADRVQRILDEIRGDQEAGTGGEEAGTGDQEARTGARGTEHGEGGSEDG